MQIHYAQNHTLDVYVFVNVGVYHSTIKLRIGWNSWVIPKQMPPIISKSNCAIMTINRYFYIFIFTCTFYLHSHFDRSYQYFFFWCFVLCFIIYCLLPIWMLRNCISLTLFNPFKYNLNNEKIAYATKSHKIISFIDISHLLEQRNILFCCCLFIDCQHHFKNINNTQE